MNKNEKPNSDTVYYIKLFSAVTLAFAGTYFALPPRGLISTLPVFLVAALISVLISIPTWQKALLFGFFAFLFALLEYDSVHALGFAALCILAVLFSSLSFYLLQRKKVFTALLSILLLFTIAYPHAYFFGNVFEANEADKKLKEYSALRYTSESIVISPTYYDYSTKYYRMSVYDEKTPTEIYTLSTRNGFIYDSYCKYTEAALMNRRMLEITTILRNTFPDDRFEVIPIKINGYPFDKQICINDDANYNDYMQFRIVLTGQLDKDYFLEKAESYFDAIKRQNLEFSLITFTAMSGDRASLKVSVTDNPFLMELEKLMHPPVFYRIDEQVTYYNAG